MNIYIEYKSYSFFKKAYQAVVDNTGKEVSKGYVIDYKGGFSKLAYRFFRRKKVYEIEYAVYGEKPLKKAIKYLNFTKNPISLTVVIDKRLSDKAKKVILSAKKTLKIVDVSNCEENTAFYRSCNKVLYKTSSEDTILSVDMMHIYKFFETAFQCKYSSCLGKNFYVDKNGMVHFCPHYLEKSVVGNINSNDKYIESTVFVTILRGAIDKRNDCKRKCEHYEYCLGGCPLEDGCGEFPETFKKSADYIDGIIKSNRDLSNENYAVAKIVIKDISYS